MKLLDDFKYLTYTLFHPFDAFYEIKWRKKGNMFLATLIILLYGVGKILNIYYNGFIVNDNVSFLYNSLFTLVASIAPFLLFIVSNWSVSTLYNGKAKMKDLYFLVCYSIFPMVVINLLIIPLSNIIILEEAPLLFSLMTFASVWSCFLIFAGLITMQEFTIQENIITLITTFIASMIIIFLCSLYFSLMEQFITFIMTVFQEIVKRR